MDPSLGLLTFKSDGGGPRGAERQLGELVVDPVDGLAFVAVEGGRRTHICKFSDVLLIRATDGEIIVKLDKKGSSNGAKTNVEEWQLSVPSLSLAETIVIVIDQHKRVLAGEGGYLGARRSRTPSSSPTVRKRLSLVEPASAAPSPLGSSHESAADGGAAIAAGTREGSARRSAGIVNDVDEGDGGDGLAAVGEEGGDREGEEDDADAVADADEEAEQGEGVDDDPSTYMALSESARGSLYDDSVDGGESMSEASWEIPIKNLRITQVHAALRTRPALRSSTLCTVHATCTAHSPCTAFKRPVHCTRNLHRAALAPALCLVSRLDCRTV